MANKGVIRLFSIIFALACIYQLSFTWVSGNVESAAREAFPDNSQAQQAYLDSMSTQTVFDLGLFSYTYAQVKEKEINLGLDLRGGMNVILEVSVKDILNSLVQNPENPAYQQLVAQTDAAMAQSQDDYLTLFLNGFAAQSQGTYKLSDPAWFGSKAINDKLGFEATDDKVAAELRSEVDASISNVYTVLRARIDQFGVVQPNIQRLENSGRILIELPGVKDPERVKKLLQSTAELEFWNLYEGVELLGFIDQANAKLRDVLPKPAAADTAKPADLGLTAIAGTDSLGAPNDSVAKAKADSAAAATFNPMYAILYPNYDFTNNQPGIGPIVGSVLIKDTAKVNRYLAMPQVRALLPAGLRYVKFAWTAKPEANSEVLQLLALRGNRNNEPELGGDVIVDAMQDFDERNRAVVTMQMNPIGAQTWQKITADAAAQNPKRSVAVVLDGYVYSFPQVQGEIPGGRTQITGNFTVEEAQDLANILKAGKLPAPARIVQADVVGPTLGAEAVSAGMWSFVVAMVIVLIYMLFYYSTAGIAANVALIVNIFFIFGILASLGAVLTLPGLAGIVLTIGMAVDANVLIYERIREELRHGKGLQLAISDGYKGALSSILDGNITTLLTGIVLYAFGTGPIRGFATTLIIGILTSLFAALFISRLIFEWYLGRKKEIHFSNKLTEKAFTKVNFDFLSKRKAAYVFSSVLILISLGSLMTRGLDFGVDFVGGRTYQVRFDQPVRVDDLSKSLAAVFVNADGSQATPQVKTIGSASQVIITTKYRIDENGPEVDDDIRAKLYQGCSPYFATPVVESAFFSLDESPLGLVAERQVGPTVADDIQKSALWAILFSLVIIFIYILIRFNSWQFSAGAVAALFHDVLITLGLFSLLWGIVPFTLEVDQAFIAAILTVIGYSLNDTVVVFDRVREYLKTHHFKRPMGEVVNDALNQTLSRTFNTSLTTLVVILIIFIFGGETIRGFMFALLVGIGVGTYSSLFIATPILVDFTKKKQLEEGKKA
jgi:SecD/SecF fusion protein